MNFSLFLNTRKRPQLLCNLLNSIILTSSNFKDIEILVRYDKDDEETEIIKNLNKNKNIIFIKGDRPNNLCKSYNELTKIAKGKNFFVLNDDVQFVTKNWDKIALEKIEEYKNIKNIKDNIYYCKTSCNSIDRDISKGYCSFPIISKEAVEILGFFMYEDFVGLGADASIYKVYKEIDRIIDITDISMDHILHRTIESVINPDITAFEMRVNTHKNFVDPFSFDVAKEVKKLREKINEIN